MSAYVPPLNILPVFNSAEYLWVDTPLTYASAVQYFQLKSAAYSFTSIGSMSPADGTIYIAPNTTPFSGSSDYYFSYFAKPSTSGSTTGSSATLFIEDAPSNATTPWALRIAAGSSMLGGASISSTYTATGNATLLISSLFTGAASAWEADSTATINLGDDNHYIEVENGQGMEIYDVNALTINTPLLNMTGMNGTTINGYGVPGSVYAGYAALSGDQSISANTDTNILTVNATTPAWGGNWRVLAMWHMIVEGGGNYTYLAYVQILGETSNFASGCCSTQASGVYTGCNGTGMNYQTYGANTALSIYLLTQGNSGYTVKESYMIVQNYTYLQVLFISS